MSSSPPASKLQGAAVPTPLGVFDIKNDDKCMNMIPLKVSNVNIWEKKKRLRPALKAA